MRNALFDDLKNLKKDITETQKRDHELQEKLIRDEKEKKLQVDFESYMKASGIKKSK